MWYRDIEALPHPKVARQSNANDRNGRRGDDSDDDVASKASTDEYPELKRMEDDEDTTELHGSHCVNNTIHKYGDT